MTTWNYILGDEKDFEGAPDWATLQTTTGGEVFFAESHEPCARVYGVRLNNEFTIGEFGLEDESDITIIAQRERVTDAAPTVTNDNINHPLRYTKGDIECIDAIKAATVGKTGIEAVDVGHVIRYLWRYEEKDGLESVKKAEWYIKHLINELESNK